MIELALGILIGVISGLIPGIHTNTLAALLVAYYTILLNFFTPSQLPVVIFAAAITHTFVDILPSVFTGIPDEDTAIAVLPAHDMVLEGRGVEAVSISALASLGSFLISIPIFFVFIGILEIVENHIYATVPYFLLITSAFIILRESDPFERAISLKKKYYALGVFLTSGFLGVIALHHAHLVQLGPASSVFLPLLSGLFASPALIISIAYKTEIPHQRVGSKMPSPISLAAGCLSGSLVSIFPGVTSGIATAMAAAGMRGSEDYLSALSAANTSNAFLCFAVFLAIDKIRSGAVDAISRFPPLDYHTLVVMGVVVALTATQLTILFALGITRVLPKINFTVFSTLVLTFLILFVIVLTGWFGLLIFAIATPVGLSTLFLQVRRINCMGCLMIPVMLIYVL
ncbi:MAG: tripartite tricarboxylate transporter permease [Candidatus Hadarchaeota archaeon]